MKKEVVILILMLSLPTILASITVKDLSVKTDYLYGSSLQGKITLSVKDEPIDSIVKLNNQKIPLKELLDSNNINYSCSTKECEVSYKTTGKGTVSKKIELSEETEKAVGFQINTDQATLKDISFDISSSFKEEEKPPLKINFFQKKEWTFLNTSDKFGPRYWGCFNPSAKEKLQKKLIVSEYCETLWIEKTPKIALGADISGKGKQNISIKIYEFPIS